MKKTDKTPRERLSIKRPKVQKVRLTANTEWYNKAYQRFSIVLRQHQPEASRPKPNIPKGRGLNS